MTSLQFDEWQDAGGTPVLRFEAGVLEVWDGAAWVAASGVAPWAEINETPTGTFNDGTYDWNYWIYKSSGTLTVNTAGRVDYVVVAGGGTGVGSNAQDNVGGGGAGGVIESAEFAQIDSGAYAVTIGAGGAATATANTQGNDGSNSSIGSLAIAVGGGGGGPRQTGGTDGGCGGGAGDNYTTGTYNPPGQGTFGQGFPGGLGVLSPGGGAGGGAGGKGSDGNLSASLIVGGVGRITTIISTTIATAQSIGEVSGSDVYFGGGGGAGATSVGGLGGGGDSSPINQRGVDCPANTGGGSGNADINEGSPYAGAGGSGVVIVRTRS